MILCVFSVVVSGDYMKVEKKSTYRRVNCTTLRVPITSQSMLWFILDFSMLSVEVSEGHMKVDVFCVLLSALHNSMEAVYFTV